MITITFKKKKAKGLRFKKNRKCPKCSTRGAISRFIRRPGFITINGESKEINKESILRSCKECDFAWLELASDNGNVKILGEL